LFRPAGWTGSFLYFFFSLPLTVALTPCRPALGFAGWVWAAWSLSALLAAFFLFY